MDTTGRRGNLSQLETDVAERGGTWTSWRVVATDHSCPRVRRHDDDDDVDTELERFSEESTRA